VKNVFRTTKKKMSGLTAQGRFIMAKASDKDAHQKRRNVQVHFWNIVGVDEHISLPKLEDAVKKEFNCVDDRFIQTQIKLMQTESRIRVQSRVKVWINQPNSQLASTQGTIHSN
jgi:hypothetical protein